MLSWILRASAAIFTASTPPWAGGFMLRGKSGVRSKSCKESKDARRHGVFANGLAGKLSQGFHFEVAPLAAGFAGLDQPVEFAVNGPPAKFASTFAAAAGGEKCGVPRLARCKPAEESARSASLLSQSRRNSTVLVCFRAERTIFDIFVRGGGRHDRANPP